MAGPSEYEQAQLQREVRQALYDLTEELKESRRRTQVDSQAQRMFGDPFSQALPQGRPLTQAEMQRAVSGPTPFWQDGDSDRATAQAGSAMSAFFGRMSALSGGPGQVMQSMGRAASGHPIEAMAQLGAQQVVEGLTPGLSRVKEQYRYMREGNPFAGEDYLGRVGDLRGRAIEKSEEAKNYSPETTSGFLGGARDRFIYIQKAREARAARRDAIEAETVMQGTARRTEAFFAPFAVGGVTPDRADITTMAKFFQRQSEASFRVHSDVQDIVGQLNSNHPGKAGQQNTR